jgi:phosphoribosylpyrophosphate synthetase
VPVVDSCARRAAAKSITAVIPYYGYKRDIGSMLGTSGEDNMASMSAADVARMLETMVRAVRPPGLVPLSMGTRLWEFPMCPRMCVCVRACVWQGVDHVISVDLQPPGFGEIEVRGRRR